MKFSPTLPRNPRFLSAGGAVSAWSALKESTRPGNKALTVPTGEPKTALGESRLSELPLPTGTAQAVPLAPPVSGGGGGIGLTITPKTSIRSAIAMASGNKAGGTGRRILLTEGTWDFPEDGLTISRSGIELVALSPGSTFFKQNARGGAPILTITGTRVRVQGITFETNTASLFAISVEGPEATISDCQFALGRSIAVPVGTAHGLCVRDNLFLDTASTQVITAPFLLNDALIVGNRMRNANAVFELSAAVRAVIVANSFAPTGSILVPFGAGNVVVGNTVGQGAASYTLADNTTNGTVSSDLSWPVASVFGVTLAYSLYRGATPDVCTGRIDIAINSTDAHVYADYQTTSVNPDVTFSGVVTGGVAYLRYSTSSTGQAATLKIDSVQERRY